MSQVLHITNGDCAVQVMEHAGIAGDKLPWRDLLHEGPVPGELPLQALSEVRARFIAASGCAPYGEILTSFQERDAQLYAFRDYQEVVLWFEHDLYDQLQLLQLLDWFAQQGPLHERVTLICEDEYLGMMTPQRMAALQDTREPVRSAQLALAEQAWGAFRAPQPAPWAELLDCDTSALGFLAASVLRHLEQYPWTGSGLNRTERQLLEAVGAGISRPGQIFEANQAADGVRFMGDSTFWEYLAAMVDSQPPLLRLPDGQAFRRPEGYPYPEAFGAQRVELTDIGRQVLNGERDWLQIRPVDKWYGGVHLRPRHIWRWEPGNRSIRLAA